MDWKLELVVVPVSDVDRAKKFYAEDVGFTLDYDRGDGEGFRFVQLTPKGSEYSVADFRDPDGNTWIVQERGHWAASQ
jgi:catechol 2,3-dioxygenase-like lactoylglutathione lyase family enzyme